MALAAFEAHPTDVVLVYYEGLDTVEHLFMRDRGSASPRADIVDRFHELVDAEVGILLAGLATAETAVVVVSDHGFRHGDDRPRSEAGFDERTAVRWHRKSGTVIASGLGFESEAPLAGSVLDVTPTLLAALGLPVADDMPGRALQGESLVRVASYGGRTALEGPDEVVDPELIAKLEASGLPR